VGAVESDGARSGRLRRESGVLEGQKLETEHSTAKSNKAAQKLGAGNCG
jgi:hypothetical protein